MQRTDLAAAPFGRIIPPRSMQILRDVDRWASVTTLLSLFNDTTLTDNGWTKRIARRFACHSDRRILRQIRLIVASEN
jgi:hypothetical protein